jgi:ribosomal protein L12E/L44/L45/RPP1/RPP2
VPPPAVQRIQSAAVGGRRASAKPGSRPLSAAGLGKARRGSKHLVPTLRSSAAGPQLVGMSSTNKILLNKGPRGNQLPPLSSSMGDYNTAAASVGAMRNNFMGSSENAYGLDNIRILQGPPAVSVTGFEGGYSLGQKNIEMARSKFLVDKLTGKLSGDLLKRRSRPATAHPGALPPRRPSQRSQVSAASSALAAKQRKDEDEEEEKVAPATNQKWSDLDKCIELLLDSKSEEETVFVYLNTNPNADPYDLLVANYQERE